MSNNTQNQITELGLYSVDKSLLSFLRFTEPNTPADDYCDYFYGPVFIREDGENFFAPVAKKPDMPDESFLVRKANGWFGPLNIGKMIPARASSLTLVDTQDPEVLKIKESSLEMHDSIAKLAQQIYENSGV